MAATPSVNTILAWAQLMRVSTRFRGAVETSFKAAGLPALAWYEVLHELAAGNETGLRPADLIERTGMAQYNLSRLLDRMERAGAVARRDDPEDGRAFRFGLTPHGRDLRQSMWQVYGDEIERLVGARMTPVDTHRLGALLATLE